VTWIKKNVINVHYVYEKQAFSIILYARSYYGIQV